MRDISKTNRRDFLLWSAALASGASACGGEDEETAIADDLTALSATQATKAMQRGDLLAEDYAEALLQRCDAGRHLNAFMALEPERVLQAAREADRRRATDIVPGPLHGLPIPVKDSVNTKDYPTTGGTPALHDFHPPDDARLVRTLVDASAIVLGKTSVHELSFGWTSNNYAFGAVRNPYDPGRIPGGSSGGTAAAIAARMAPLGVAEDTQGSIRVPAALCGICGFRPTTHRYPNEGVMPITPLFDQVGPHARTVEDLMLFDSVVTGEAPLAEPPSLKGVRLGIDRNYFYGSLDSEVERLTAETLRILGDAGAVLVEAEVPGLSELVALTTLQILLFDVVPQLNRYLDNYNAGISFDELLSQASEDIQAVFEDYVLPGGAYSPSKQDFVDAVEIHLPALKKTMQDYFRYNDLAAMIFPATMAPASPIGEDLEIEVNGETVSLELIMSRNISPGSTAGIPGLVVPMGLTSAGLPAGLELDGPEGRDRSLLALGQAVEGLLEPLPPPVVESQA
jgi:mandelamide amidase